MPQLNLSQIQIGKEETAFATETSQYVELPGLVSKGDVTPSFKKTEYAIQDMSSRNEAGMVLHGETNNSMKMKMRLQNGRPFLWLMGGYSVVAGIQILASGNTITFDLAGKTITRASGSWIDDGLTNLDVITIAGSTSNNGAFTINTLTALVITVDEAIADESMTTGTLLISPPFTHSISNSNTIASHSIEYVINKSYSHIFLGNKLNELVFTMSKGQPVICETSFLASEKLPIDSSPNDPSILSTVPWEFHQMTVFTINGEEYKCDARQLKLTLSNGLETEWGLCSQDAQYISEGMRKFMINAEIFEADKTLLDLYENETEFAISIELTRGYDKMTITIPKAKLFEPSYNLGGNSVVDILPIRVIGDWTVTFLDDEITYDK